MSDRESQMNVRSGERGIAMILALFMVLILSVLAASLIFVARTETFSSLNYRTMAEARYGAESAVHSTVNYLLSADYPAPTTPYPDYDITQSPVRLVANGRPAVLSSDEGWGSNYPVEAVRAAFVGASAGQLSEVGASSIMYTSRATLLSMKSIPDAASGIWTTLQTWEVTGRGRVAGAASAAVEVSAILERPMVPLYKYAAFATDNGCEALKFGGGATTGSYDSSTYSGSGTPTIDNNTGNVGTNGNLNELGTGTTINGTLSTPRTGVGTCAAGAVTALTSSGGATITDGLVELSQAVNYPTPPAISPLPPVTTDNVQKNSGCLPGVVAYCSAQPGVGSTIHPMGATVTLGNVRVEGGAVLHLGAGTY